MVPYLALMGLGVTALLMPAVRCSGALRGEWRMSDVVAARELSIVLSAFVGSRWFREGALGPRLAGAAVVLAGVICVALAR